MCLLLLLPPTSPKFTVCFSCVQGGTSKRSTRKPKNTRLLEGPKQKIFDRVQAIKPNWDSPEVPEHANQPTTTRNTITLSFPTVPVRDHATTYLDIV